MPGDKDCKEGGKGVRVGKPRPRPPPRYCCLLYVQSWAKLWKGLLCSALQRAGSTEPGWSWLNFTCRASPLDSALPYGIPGGKRVVAAWALSARRFALPSLPKAALFSYFSAQQRNTQTNKKRAIPNQVRPPAPRSSLVAWGRGSSPGSRSSSRQSDPEPRFTALEIGIRADPQTPSLRDI